MQAPSTSAAGTTLGILVDLDVGSARTGVPSVERLLADASMRQELGRKARAYAENTFDIRRIGQRFEALLK